MSEVAGEAAGRHRRIVLASGAPAAVDADLLVVPFFSDHHVPAWSQLESALGLELAPLLKQAGMRGAAGESLRLATLGKIPPRTLVLLGLGAHGDASRNALFTAAMRAGRRDIAGSRVAVALEGIGEPGEVISSLVSGLLLGLYRFDRYRSTQHPPRAPVDEVALLGLASPATTSVALQREVASAVTRTRAVNWARDLVNTPAADMSPAVLAQAAQDMSKSCGIECRTWTARELEAGGFGGILGVGAGSRNEPALIELRYRTDAETPPVALSGKGITFDSGGLSLKGRVGQEWMKADMAGAAAVLAAMRATAELEVPISVIAAIPSAENMPSGSALRPGDIVRHRGGRTTLVTNTDAEGRLVLADALAYLAEQKPREIVDAATMTESGLGEDLFMVVGNDRSLTGRLLRAGEAVAEPGWEFPLWRPYRRKFESAIADLKNSNHEEGRVDALCAAVLLSEFVGDIPWAHIDMGGGCAYMFEATDDWAEGATGSPTRTLIEYLSTLARVDSREAAS